MWDSYDAEEKDNETFMNTTVIMRDKHVNISIIRENFNEAGIPLGKYKKCDV